METKFATILLAAALVLTSVISVSAQHETSTTFNIKGDQSIRPFHIQIPESKIKDLKARILNTKFPDSELVGDETQGVKLSTIKALADLLGTSVRLV